MRFALIAGLMASMMAAGTANAVPTTWNIDFEASGFNVLAPDPMSGSFTLTFDPTQGVSNSTAGLTVNSLAAPTTDGPGYSYVLGTDRLILGDLLNGTGTHFDFTNDWSLVIYNFTTGPGFFFSATNRFEQGSEMPYVLNASVSVVPLPPALLMVLSAFAGLGLLRRRRFRGAIAA